MSKQLAVSIAFSVIATLCLALFAVDPAVLPTSGGSTPSLIQAATPPLPALSQLLPSLN